MHTRRNHESAILYSFNCSSVTLAGASTNRSLPVADFGNAITSRIELDPHNIAINRSKPMAIPDR